MECLPFHNLLVFNVFLKEQSGSGDRYIILLYSIREWYENHPQKAKQDFLLAPLMNSNPSRVFNIHKTDKDQEPIP